MPASIFNPLAPELDFKFWRTFYIKCKYIMDQKKVTLLNAQHFVEEKMEIMQHISKNSVSIFVD
jgi:hypothetical protein